MDPLRFKNPTKTEREKKLPTEQTVTQNPADDVTEE